MAMEESTSGSPVRQKSEKVWMSQEQTSRHTEEAMERRPEIGSVVVLQECPVMVCVVDEEEEEEEEEVAVAV
ncbi:hypothetical protein lerEdw1_009766 [Lerista edwardsae]|nr:hypothetical protein lerEdw1_009766 [Lerista edwardsae]